MYFESWKTAWDFQKQFADMPDTQEAWQEFYSARDKVLTENQDNKFLCDLITCVWHELRRQQKAVR